jgi:hypothetical protein
LDGKEIASLVVGSALLIDKEPVVVTPIAGRAFTVERDGVSVYADAASAAADGARC